MFSFIFPVRWENQRNLVSAYVIKRIHEKTGNNIPSSVTPVSQQEVTHISAKENSHINLGIKLSSKFAGRAENKTKEHLITLVENNDSLMSFPL